MIKIEKILFSIGGRKLLDTGNITIPSGHKIGVVGRNGTGKTTLFGLIKGDLELESGQIILPKNAKIDDVKQEVSENDLSVLETILAADEERETLIKQSKTEKDPVRIAEIDVSPTVRASWPLSVSLAITPALAVPFSIVSPAVNVSRLSTATGLFLGSLEVTVIVNVAVSVAVPSLTVYVKTSVTTTPAGNSSVASWSAL